jgi:hypothetical protein
MMRKFLGFIAGFVATLLIIAFVFSAMGLSPRGPFWVFICIAGGWVGSKFVSNPRGAVEAATDVVTEKAQPAIKRWWALDERLRLVLVASAIWMVASFVMQDRWEREMGIVLIPPLALIALHIAERKLVRKKPETDSSSND